MSLDSLYDIQSPIHIGQITAAYPAIRKSDNRKVFLKVIHPQWTQDSELLNRFEREAQSLASVDHPNVVQIIDYSVSGDIPYIVIEWMDGGTIADLISAGPIPQKDLKDIVRKILSGLNAVHECGLIHRDIKPDNILRDGEENIKLADFSLAGYEKRSSLTQHGAIIGSPAYMAPELIEGKPASVQSDLYSCGVILYESLTGSNPFKSNDPLNSFELIRKYKHTPLSSKQNIDIGLGQLIDSLLARSPEDRPSTAQAALGILEQKSIADTKPVESKVPHRSSKPARRFKRRYALYVLLPVILLTALLLIVPELLDRGNPIEELPADSVVNIIPQTDLTEMDSNPDSLIEQPNEIAPAETVNLLTIDSTATQSIVDDPLIQADHTQTTSGILSLIVRPWAEVFINGDKIGITPLGNIDLQPGNHDLILKHSVFPEVTRQVEIHSGDTTRFEITLQDNLGSLSISAKPWGVLWVDQDSIGLLPRKEPIWLLPGEHKLTVEHPAYDAWQDTLTLEAGQKTFLLVDMVNGTIIAN